jgi:predicted TIM-barrel fold metal-dependent hydrolase
MRTADANCKIDKGSDMVAKSIKVIDTDAHFSESHDLWLKRAPAHMRSRVPQVKMLNGKMSWVIDGDKSIGTGAFPHSAIDKNGAKASGRSFEQFTMADVHPSSYDLKARLEMMDTAGIWAQIIYPNILGFGGQHIFGFGGQLSSTVDPELRLLSVRIYNDAMAELQQDSHGRLYPMAILPWWDVNLAVVEAKRISDMGLRGVNINSDPHWYKGGGSQRPDLGHRYWDPFWEVCCRENIPVNFHIGASEQGSTDWYGDQWPTLSQDKKVAAGGTMLFFNNGRAIANLIYSGLLDRFPPLKFVNVESGLGWIPFLLESLDYQFKEVVMEGTLKRAPSEYFKSNFYSCFWFENSNLADSVRAVGLDNVMFETAFPYPTCLFPLNSHGNILPDLTEEELHKVMCGNAAKVYRIPLE